MVNQAMDNQTIDMQRAQHTYNQVMAIQEKNYGHYVSYVKGLPASILQNGFGQAMATLLAAAKGKTDEPHRLLYNQIEEWLCKTNGDSPYSNNGGKSLMDCITENDEDAYLYAQAEALAYLSWLKKFAVAYLNEKPQNESSEEE